MKKTHLDDFGTNNFSLDWKIPCQIMFYLVVLQDHITDNFNLDFEMLFEFTRPTTETVHLLHSNN